MNFYMSLLHICVRLYATRAKQVAKLLKKIEISKFFERKITNFCIFIDILSISVILQPNDMQFVKGHLTCRGKKNRLAYGKVVDVLLRHDGDGSRSAESACQEQRTVVYDLPQA